MTAATCLSASLPEAEPNHALAEKPRRLDCLAAGVTMLVVLLHGAVLAPMFAVPPAPADVQRPVLQGALMQQSAVLEPEPVADSPAPKPAPAEPVAPPEPVPEPLPVQPDGVLSTSPEPVAEPTRPEPPGQEQTAPVPEPVAASAPVTAPRADAQHLNNPAPAYPMLSRRLREQGTVLLQLLILRDGSIAELRVVQSSGYARLDAAAMEAVQQWRFEPARRGDQAIDYTYQQPITFQLQ